MKELVVEAEVAAAAHAEESYVVEPLTSVEVGQTTEAEPDAVVGACGDSSSPEITLH